MTVEILNQESKPTVEYLKMFDSKSAGKIRLYAAGGCGTNLATKVSDLFDVCYVDTSASNHQEGVDTGNRYLISGLDGSGKNRRENYAIIAKEVPAIIEKFEPAVFNVVVFSASGGSGSTLGPLIIKSLLEDEQAVVAVVVGADDSAITINNTVNTIKSLESISAMTGLPVVMSYHQNTPGVSRGSVDDEVEFVLHALGILTSGENQELDTKDLANWVQYHKVSPVMPQLSFLSVLETRQDALGVVEPIAVVSLYSDPSKDNPFGNPYYNSVGFPRQEMDISEQLHFVINIADVEESVKGLQERQVELGKRYSGYRQRKTAVDVDDTLTSDGLVL